VNRTVEEEGRAGGRAGGKEGRRRKPEPFHHYYLPRAAEESEKRSVVQVMVREREREGGREEWKQ
jgi:hypothetical protein